MTLGIHALNVTEVIAPLRVAGGNPIAGGSADLRQCVLLTRGVIGTELIQILAGAG
jgi:hypothetical protein